MTRNIFENAVCLTITSAHWHQHEFDCISCTYIDKTCVDRLVEIDISGPNTLYIFFSLYLWRIAYVATCNID